MVVVNASMPPAPDDAPPDVANIRLRDCPIRALPPVVGGRRQTRFQVIFKQSVLNEIHSHGRSVENTEICGVLVGNVYRDSYGAFLYVESSIRGEYASNQSCNVTFTAETWNHIQGVMEREHAERKILGWYHTHPGFGIFLSDMDLFIHGNFFNLPWQVAFVYDPHSGEEGLFLWEAGKTRRDAYLREEDQPAETPAAQNTLDKPASRRRPATRWIAIGGVVVLAAAIAGAFLWFR